MAGRGRARFVAAGQTVRNRNKPEPMHIHTTLIPKLTLLGGALALAGAAYAGFSPIPITPGSYTGDAVVENTAAAPLGVAVNATIDNGIALQTGTGTPYAATWNERGFFPANPNTGLPPAGTVFTALSNSAMSFVMAPSYAANNTILIDGTVTNGAWIPVTPAAYSHLSFISSGGNGGRNINVTVYHQNGAVSTGTFSSPDWFGGTTGVALITAGRINAQNHTGDNLGAVNPRLYYRNVALANTTSPVTNITLTLGVGGGTGHVGVMAVSGSTDGVNFTPIYVTGYNADVVVEATAAQPGALTGVTTLTMDGGPANTGNTWYERGYQPFFPNSGLPPAGSVIASAALPDHSYQMPDSYTANNVIYVDSATPVANITPVTPGAYSALSFLSATANGNVTNSCTVQYQDGTEETKVFISRDWFNNTPWAYLVGGRINTSSKVFDAVNTQNPRLYEAQFALGNTVSPVTNVVLTWLGAPNAAGRAFVFALSGSTGPVPPIIGDSPQARTIYEGTSFALDATVTGGNAPFTYKWQKGTNGVYVDLDDGGRWSGTETLSLSNSAATLADLADYRVRVANAAGAVNSGAAAITVLTTNVNVLQPGDSISRVNGSSPGGEDVANAIDGTTSKYLNFGLNSGSQTPVGFIVTPSLGSTYVMGIRLFTANDATARDPANTILEGSNDGGATWTLIWSNRFTLPDARNAGGLATDPMARAMIERTFANPNAYTVYRWTVTELKNRPGANSMQIGEVQLLGRANPSPQPIFLIQPTSMAVYDDGAGLAFFSAYAAGSPEPTYQWQKGTNGVFVNLVDNPRVSGAQSSSLFISQVEPGDAADYRVAATNSAGHAFSAVAHLAVISALPDVTRPGDPVTVTGDLTGNTGTAPNLINNTIAAYANGGHGPSAQAGFPPFEGPVSMTITPSKGASIVSGLRFYTSGGASAADPADFRLEASSDGVAYTLLAGGTLNLPEDRNLAGATLDPLTQAIQEVRFANSQPFTSYRLTVTNAKNNDATATLQIGEIELLGLPGPSIQITPPYANVPVGGSAFFTATATGSGSLTYQWKKRTPAGAYVPLTNGGGVSGATTETLILSGVSLADSGEYAVTVTDDTLPATSQMVILNVVSTDTDVTQPGDDISSFGGPSPGAEGVEHAIDNLTDKYLNFGADGDNGPPFFGPVGLVVTPAAGATLVTGLRLYAANDAPERDPANYLLEGSNDGGAAWSGIASGAVFLHTDRNGAGAGLDPLNQVNREIRFDNHFGYATYRLTLTNVRNNAAANSLQVAEIELLGQAVVIPVLTASAGAGGTLVLSTTVPGTLWSTTELKETGTVWVNEGPISGTLVITPAPGTPAKLYRVSTP